MSENSAATPAATSEAPIEPVQTRAVIHEGLPTQLPDIDPEETQEWLDSFDDLTAAHGRDRARAGWC